MTGKIITIFLLVAAIAGGSGYLVYEMYLKPKRLDRLEKEAVAAAVPTPTPDPSLAAFKSLEPLLEQNTIEARDALQTFLKDHPGSPMESAVREALGRINIAIVLSPMPTPEKTNYVVKKGDSLVKIAAQFKTGAELIYRTNQLQTINLKIGQELVIPPMPEIQIVLNRASGIVTLLNNGVFFKEYPTLSIKLPPAVAKGTVETKVHEKLAMKAGTRVAFGTKDFDGSDRWVVLGLSGVTIRGMPAPGADGVPAAAPPTGIIVDPAAAEEIFVLVRRGTPVSIQ